jgi:hypothetical protein
MTEPANAEERLALLQLDVRWLAMFLSKTQDVPPSAYKDWAMKRGYYRDFCMSSRLNPISVY